LDNFKNSIHLLRLPHVQQNRRFRKRLEHTSHSNALAKRAVKLISPEIEVDGNPVEAMSRRKK